MLPTEARFEVAEFGEIPLFNEDVEKVGTPAAAAAFCAAVKAADGVVIATPEYNRGVPGGLKNAIDWSSRVKGLWDGKKVFVMGATPGSLGTASAHYELVRIFTYFNAKLVGQPEVLIGGVYEKIDAAGNIIDPKTKESLQKAAEHFAGVVRG